MLNKERLQMKKSKDDAFYREAIRDLLDVLKISTPREEAETKQAIFQILNHFGASVPEIPKNIKNLGEQLEYILRPSGMMKRAIELNGSWWKDGTGAILAHKKDGDVVALIPNKFSGYHYIDKSGKKIRLKKSNVQEFGKEAFGFYQPLPSGPVKIVDLLKFMAKNVSSTSIMMLLGVYLVMQLLGMMLPYLTNIIYGVLVPSGSLDLLKTVSMTLVGLLVGRLSIKIIQGCLRARIHGKLNLAINSAIMMRLFNLPANFFKNYSSGDLASRIGYVAMLCRTISETFLSTILTALFSLGYIFQMIQQAPSMFNASMLIIFVQLCFSVIVTLIKQNINNEKMKINPKLQSLVFDLFNGMQKIKIAGAERRAFAIWAKQYSKCQKFDFDPPLIIKISGVIGGIISSLGMIILYWIAAKNKVSIVNYMTFGIAYGAVSSAIMSLNDVALKLANLKPIIDLINPFMKSDTENKSKGKIVNSLYGLIEINNVSFKYHKNSDLVINNLSLKIKPGEYVSIVGQTGCGKSTILRLLLGFETPLKGGIYYDNRDIGDLDKNSLRRKIGVVMQNGSLFQGDIYSNITVTAPWKTIDDAWKAAELAGLDKDIAAMPMQMHTLISEGTGGISGGQKQRLMIARALINKPKILFFDEATSALDNITQEIIADNIDKLRCTRVVIAHRLSTIKNCDRILVMDKGRIVEEGKFEDLMAKKGLFYELAKRQMVESI